jgi:DNA polymerase-4
MYNKICYLNICSVLNYLCYNIIEHIFACEVSFLPKIILLADMESFYASVEIANNPSLRKKPVIVCGDPKLRHGITLAASKEAKTYGIKTGMSVRECKCLCPHAVFIKPHMKKYIEISIKLTNIFEQFTDRVSPYSIDEQFLDMTGCERLFGTSIEMAKRINAKVLEEINIRSRIGIGENPLQAKMACDNFAKKNRDGIFKLDPSNYPKYTWNLPINKLFGIGNRMTNNLKRLGIFTIGDLAQMPKEKLKYYWGIMGELLWLNSHGIDYSTINSNSTRIHKGVGHSITLPRDYLNEKEIKVVLLEITEEVCKRARNLGKLGKVVSLYCKGANFDDPKRVIRQKKLPEPTIITMDVYFYVIKLFNANWYGYPVRTIGVSLSELIDDNPLQLSFFNNKEKKMNLHYTTDEIRDRFGKTSLFRASSLTSGGQLFERANKIGGHES